MTKPAIRNPRPSYAHEAGRGVGGDAANGHIDFLAGGNETATFGTPGSVSASFKGFATTDRIALTNFVETSDSFLNGVLTLNSGAGSVSLNFVGPGNSISTFGVTDDGVNTYIHHS